MVTKGVTGGTSKKSWFGPAHLVFCCRTRRSVVCPVSYGLFVSKHRMESSVMTEGPQYCSFVLNHSPSQRRDARVKQKAQSFEKKLLVRGDPSVEGEHRLERYARGPS